MVETGTATAPARKQPRMAASMGSPSDIIEQHPVVRPDPRLAQRGGDDPAELVELGVRRGLGGADRDLVAEPVLDVAG